MGAVAVPDIPAKAWLIADASTGQILAAKGLHDQLPPASTLKTLTAVALMPKLAPDDLHTAVAPDLQIYGSKTGMVIGHSYSIRDLWYGLLLDSGNDSALGLAHQYSAVTSDTLDLMAREAKRLQARDTVIRSPHGLDAPGQVSSVYDMALFARAALSIPLFTQISSTRSYAFPSPTGSFQIQNENPLLGKYSGVLAGKTGFTTNAGRTFWVAVKRGNVTLLAVLFGIETGTTPASRALLDWGFANHSKVTPIGALPDPLKPTITKAPAAHNQQVQLERTPNWWVLAIAGAAGFFGLFIALGGRRVPGASVRRDHARREQRP